MTGVYCVFDVVDCDWDVAAIFKSEEQAKKYVDELISKRSISGLSYYTPYVEFWEFDDEEG